MIACPYCSKGTLTRTDQGYPDRYDYAVFRCLATDCARQTAVLVVALKHTDARMYDQMVKDGVIDPRYNVIRPRLAA